ncbi:MAG: SUMF1/EgtB/PvdO family nonheme iron enzyme, partial [Nostoc sp. C3-bin3]|nr:SUMF1/EgtB/PvdO family nonheme iron enzyme [Nostoc sp. C3-bin3]
AKCWVSAVINPFPVAERGSFFERIGASPRRYANAFPLGRGAKESAKVYRRGKVISYLLQFPKYSVPVGSFSANAFGLYDIHGNISEWY